MSVREPIGLVMICLSGILQEVLSVLKPAVGAGKPSQTQAQLYKTVLNQRSSNGQTPLSAACATGWVLSVHSTPVGTCWELLALT